jgi:hypothetical protein
LHICRFVTGDPLELGELKELARKIMDVATAIARPTCRR